MSVTLLTNPATFNLKQGDRIVVKVRATNEEPLTSVYSLQSTSNTFVVARPHQPPQAPIRNEPLTTRSLIYIDLPTVDLTLAGGLPITGYSLEWNSGGEDDVYTVLYEDVNTQTSVAVTTGTMYKFRYRLMNDLGYSVDYSPVLITYGAKAAGQMMPPQTEIYQNSVRIFWTDEAVLDSGGIPLSAYQILIRTWDDQYLPALASCDGTSLTVVTDRQCFVPLATLTSSPFLLSQGTIVKAKIQAINYVGASPFSNPNALGALIEIVPHKPAVAPMRDPTTLRQRLVINVTPITGTLTGGADIMSYELQMSTSVSGTFNSLEGGEPNTYKTTTQFIVTNGIVAGQTYIFRYRVLNRQGWSEFSGTTAILAAQVPLQVGPVVTSMNAANVKIAWITPDNGASALLKYVIMIQKADGTYAEEVNYCDGSNFVILARAFCEIPMQVLTSAPYSLPQGALIRATVTAYNIIGASIPSTLNADGELAQVAPLKPAASPKRNSDTSESLLKVDYDMLTGVLTGGSTIFSLQLQWDQGTSGASWATLLGFSPYTVTTTYSITGLDRVSSGRVYKFRYRARNIHGWGPYSDVLDLLAASIPDRLSPVITQLVGTQVQISWVPLKENGAQITQYLIELKTLQGAYIEMPTLCDGTNENVLANNYCLFPMATFLASPLSLLQGDLIVARIAVKNAIGWTLPSADNTQGVLVQTRPLKPLPMTYDVAQTDTTKATVYMTALVAQADIGGSPILSYSLEWDNGSNGASFVSLIGGDGAPNNIQLLYIATDLTAG